MRLDDLADDDVMVALLDAARDFALDPRPGAVSRIDRAFTRQ
jgi:hypothetical protein